MKTIFATILTLIFSVFGIAQSSLFEHVTSKDGLGSNNVNDLVHTPEGELWVVTNNSICKIEGLGFEAIHLEDTSLLGLVQDYQGKMWVYSSSGNIYTYNGEKIIKTLSGLNLESKIINKITFENHDNFWIGAVKSGALINVLGGNISHETLPEDCGYFLKELENKQFIWGTGSAPEENNRLWVQFKDKTLSLSFTKKGEGAKSSFFKLDNGEYLFAKDFELIHFNRNGLLNRVFVEKNIQAIYQDSENKIWLGLSNGGVICYPNGDVTNKNYISYLERYSITCITEDYSNNIWIGTRNNGVFYLPLQQELTYSPPQLFSDTSQNSQQAKAIAKKVNNFSQKPLDFRVISTTSAMYDSIPPKAHINGVKIMNRDTLIQKKYVLNYDQNFLKISYIGFAYNSPEHIQYSYRMFGLDRQWTFTSNTKVQYTTLPPGQYHFVVNAMNKEGVWGERTASITFNILPPYWETWWFRIGVVISGIGLILTILITWTRRIKRNERKKMEMEKRMAMVELKALRSQMNPHFMFNTMSSIQHYITLNDTESALTYLSKFSRLMRRILDNSKRARIPIKDEIDALTLYLLLESLRFKNKFSYFINVDPSIDSNFDEIPSMLIQPYVENAIIHGVVHNEQKGQISIELIREKETIKCTIIDNGIGREKSREMNRSKNKQHQSAGMSITRERLEILNAAHDDKTSVRITDLKDENNQATGTKVEITIPI